MITARELITICRQIGTMMEVGVDFLRILRALREQTDNPRLLELYDQIEHDMRMGGNLADAIDKAPDVFSPFAVSLIRQGDVRGDIEGAWHRLADFYKQEAQENKDLGLDASGKGAAGGAARAGIEGGEAARGLEQLEWLFISFVGWLGALLLAITLVWCAAAGGFLAPRWMVPLQLGLAALLAMIAAGNWSAKRDQRERNRVSDAPAPLGQNRTPVAVAPPPLSHLPADEESVRAAMDEPADDDFNAPRFGQDEERPF